MVVDRGPLSELRSPPSALAWLCRRHDDGNRVVPQGDECPACGATEPLDWFDRLRDVTQR